MCALGGFLCSSLGSCLQAGLASGQVLGALAWPGVCLGLRLSSGGCGVPLLFVGVGLWPVFGLLCEWRLFCLSMLVAVFFPLFGSLLSC